MFKRISLILISLLVLGGIAVYLSLWLSLPSLSGDKLAPVSGPTTLQRDNLGIAIITAENRQDAAYVLGFAHAQDRLFQMDLLRRSASGELAALFGDAALNRDKKVRFHQFRKRAKHIYTGLPAEQQDLLNAYTKGVNDALAEYTVLPFEYLILQQSFKPWLPEDSLLVSYSMYMDLQHGQVLRDLALTRVAHHFGQAMADFLVLPSSYQAALDGSVVPLNEPNIPLLNLTDNPDWAYTEINEPIDIGSNNWAVSANLTANDNALLSDDMHLGLNVPPIWYRASIRYSIQGQSVELNGVSLPGVPGIVVGSNGMIAWGFTNANLDNADWIKLDADSELTQTTESISSGSSTTELNIALSPFGPVKKVGDELYALSWVAHQDYAVNLRLKDLDQVTDVQQARDIAVQMGIPVQNMVVADQQGNIGWFPAGAVTARTNPSNTAIDQAQYSPKWQQQATDQPSVINPDNQRIWTANARVIAADDLARFGNGGYALGARGMQIRDRLFEYEQFDEQRFYDIQLDNKAWFLSAWQRLLLSVLQQQPEAFEQDIRLLKDWQACACPSSIGYTLTRRFRSQVLNQVLAPIENKLAEDGISLSPVLRHVEPSIWQILKQQPYEWLPASENDWDSFLLQSYRDAKQRLLDRYADSDAADMSQLAWGKVNQLEVKHPFSHIMPVLAPLLDMPSTPGFGDSYMPAVQNGSHGASQRLIVQPGLEQNAILTVPGGQSGHPLSQYYRQGFEQYIENAATPLLPSEVTATLRFKPTH